MPTSLNQKSSLSEIEERFENDVERFSNLETGQVATIDAPLAMELITQAAISATPNISRILDIGCGAGNNTIKLLRSHSKAGIACDLNDLSRAMLDRAKQRVSQETTGTVSTICGDFRTANLQDGSYDVIIAAAVLHHLRDEADWFDAFSKIYRLLKPSGSFWITDLVTHESPAVHELMWKRYGEYLESKGGVDYRKRSSITSTRKIHPARSPSS